MMPDVNVLVACAMEEHVHHTVAQARMVEAIANTASPPAIPMPVLTGFVRVATSPRIFVSPLLPQDAFAFVDVLLSVPGLRLLDGVAAWPRFRQLCLERAVRGAPASDAWLAASALHHRETLVTFDRDFVRLLPPAQLELLRTS